MSETRPTSLKSRMILRAALGTVLLVGSVAFAIDFIVRSVLLDEFDDLLKAKAMTLAGLIEREGTEVEVDFDENAQLSEFQRTDHAEYYQIWGPGGQSVARSRSLDGADLDPPARNPESIVLPDGRAGRILAVAFVPREESEEGKSRWLVNDEEAIPDDALILVLARATVRMDGTVASLRVLLLALGGFATLVLLALLAWVLRRGFQSVEKVAADIQGVGEQELGARLDLKGVPRELVPVVERLNDLLSRLEAAFLRERAFSSNVAHELRTPLAGLRSTLEVALARPRKEEEYRGSLTECLAICNQTQAMIDVLLRLGRAEADGESVHRERVDVAELMRSCWSSFQEAASARSLDVEWRLPGELEIETDREKLQLVVRNILENAVMHSNPGGNIKIEVEERDAAVGIEVRNSGSQVSGEDARHVFERFWRGDRARDKTGFHSGLGLALCRELVQRMGGSIGIRSEKLGEFVVRLEF